MASARADEAARIRFIDGRASDDVGVVEARARAREALGETFLRPDRRAVERESTENDEALARALQEEEARDGAASGRALAESERLLLSGRRDERARGVLWVWRDVHGERSARRGARVRRDVAFEVFALRRVRREFVERVDVFRSRGRGRGDGG